MQTKTNSPTPTPEFLDDLQYLRDKLARTTDNKSKEGLKLTISMLEQEIGIIPEGTTRTNPSTFEFEVWNGEKWLPVIVLPTKDKYIIPASLLVQTFMRKLRDGMDRRRP